jgi:hypothetical protein
MTPAGPRDGTSGFAMRSPACLAPQVTCEGQPPRRSRRVWTS